jgi:hypothetical protein
MLAIAALALACGSEAPEPSGASMARAPVEDSLDRVENASPRVDRLVLNPPRPLPGQRVEAHVEASDPDGDPIRLELEWRVAGRVLGRGSQTAMAIEGARKGDEVVVFATATDGRAQSDPMRASVTVGNTPPTIAAFYLAPDGEIAPGQDVTAAPQAVDPDGDALEYEFEWVLNGRTVRGADEAVFATERLKRGDRLQALVRVSDGEAWSPVAESMTLTLANQAPKFTSYPEVDGTGGGVSTQLEAEDPDGDRSLRFRLLSGPAGMTVDPVTGRLRWRPGPKDVGTHAVEVAVADAQGAESAMRFELNVSGGGAGGETAPAKRDPAADEDE